MTQNLYPAVDVPEISETPAEEKYKPSLYFDFERGDFRLDGNGNITVAGGREAYYQWCRKTAMTERFACLSYGDDIGVNMEDALAQEDAAAVESAVERTLTETLMVNPKTEYVREFAFAWAGDALRCSFVVKGTDWEEQRMEIRFNR